MKTGGIQSRHTAGTAHTPTGGASDAHRLFAHFPTYFAGDSWRMAETPWDGGFRTSSRPYWAATNKERDSFGEADDLRHPGGVEPGSKRGGGSRGWTTAHPGR
ncbi:MAG: hypothetical protein ABIH46_05895, partial [Chloroflexota bacterium]